MREHNVLKEAFEASMEREISEAEETFQMQAPIAFSDGFEASMQRLIAHQKSGEVADDLQLYLPSAIAGKITKPGEVKTPVHNRITLKGRRVRRVALTAIIAVLIFAMSITALALIKPGIYFRIREIIDYLDIMPQREDAAESEAGFTPVSPGAPEGYDLAEETYDPESCHIEYRDHDGRFISIYQFVPDGSRIYQDAMEGDRKESINGHEAIITVQDRVTTIITENDESVIIISGSCGYEALYDIAVQLTETND